MARRQALDVAVLVALGCSAVALAVAPLLLPESYSWVAHTTSESGAQGVSGAWLARVGFVLFGGAVLGLVGLAWRRWGTGGTLLFSIFGLAMLAVGAFSTRSWTAGTPFDEFENTVHSVAATVMGFAFAFGVATVSVHRWQASRQRPRVIDVAAVAAATLLPLGMVALPGVDGVLQRLMFLVAFAWYAREAHALRDP